MRRIISTVALTGGLALAGIFLAPAANADVTNPADNPSPITVTGDDGLTYSDGLDTLPGYDDYECTYIPGAYFDFDNNRVRYADGQSIPWTEWDRATGYKSWLAKKASAPAPATTPPPAPATTPPPATATTPPPASGAHAAAAPAGTETGKVSTTTSHTSSGTKTTGGATSGGAVVGGTSPSGAASAPASAKPSAARTSVATVGASGSPSPTEEATVLAEGSGQGGVGSAGPAGATAGLAILGGLFGVGGLAFGGYAFKRRGGRGEAV